MTRRPFATLLLASAAALALDLSPLGSDQARADYGWRGRRPISYQDPHDLFYNYYVGPQPSGTAAQLYVSPRPVPESVGHTYNTYQPLYPHEFTYGHTRSWHTHYPGAGWTRTKAYYSAPGNMLQHAFYRLNY